MNEYFFVKNHKESLITRLGNKAILSLHEKVSLTRLLFERCFSHYSRDVSPMNPITLFREMFFLEASLKT